MYIYIYIIYIYYIYMYIYIYIYQLSNLGVIQSFTLGKGNSFNTVYKGLHLGFGTGKLPGASSQFY